ncbi:MAG: FAD-dependent oxidoreductase [Deltaproteobacteria bacterium]|nr:FAD-dependent oxidoreductase [Deltaproteobacteria bacterium]
MARHVVAIVGGAVAGSEAAALVAEKGGIAVVFEQGERPYGKIEDGLPRWHEKLRIKEYERIDENLSHESVYFVPKTEVGGDVSFEELRSLGFNAIILANGAWRDRRLPVEGVEAYVGKGLLYQNALVHWFNHEHEPGYDGPRYEIPEGAIVVGGGLASVDVVKILSLVTHARALEKAGHAPNLIAMEQKGIAAWCEREGIPLPEVELPTLYYRRSMEEMPLASPPDDATERQLEKVRGARVKIMERVMDRYRVKFVGSRVPVAPFVEEERLAGLVFRKTEGEGRAMKEVPGSEEEVRAPLVISSIGSIPLPIVGLPMKGELYDFADWETGEVSGMEGVFGLGNVLTGKGNIKASRQNAAEVTAAVFDAYLDDEPFERLHEAAREAAEPVVAKAMEGTPLERDQRTPIRELVQGRWKAIGYSDYPTWAEAHRAP